MMLMARAVALVAMLVLVSCVPTVKLAPTGAYNSPGYAVTLARPWNDITPIVAPRTQNVRYLTIDGAQLNRLYLASLEPGQSLVRPTNDARRPKVRPDMSDDEAAAFVIESLAAIGYQAPQSAALHPQNLGNLPGVRFDIATHTAEGLNVSGTALVARSGGTLHVLLFLAPSEHFYPAMSGEVETMFASAMPRT
jgi:hypothetical protein